MNTSPTPRLYVEDALGAGRTVTLDTEQAHYLQHVMRLKPGAALRLFNGRDGEWDATLAKTLKRAAEITINKQTRAQTPAPDLWLYCAPIKKAHFEYMIEKATELGTGAIHPLLTARTQIREVNVERCRAIAIEAAEQSERLDIPEIHKSQTLEKFAAQWTAGRTLIVCAEWGDATPINQALQNLRAANSRAAIVTGPEGGFAEEELHLLRKIPGAVFVRLGPRILRADTAAIAVLGCWQAVCGDWSQSAEDRDQASE